MNGAFLSGIALMNSGTGPAAAMSYPLGVHFKVPHGIAGGVFLPHVIRYNIEMGYYQYADIYDCITDRDVSHKYNEQEKAQLFLKKILSLWKVLSIPDDLVKLGLKTDFMPQFIRETMELKGALDQNPVPFYEDGIVSVLKQLKVT